MSDFFGDEVLPLWVGDDCRFQVVERIGLNQTPADGRVEELLGDLRVFADRVFRHPVSEAPNPPFVGVAFGDGLERCVASKLLQEPSPGRIELRSCPWFQVGSRRDVLVDEAAEGCLIPLLNKADIGQLATQLVLQFGDPLKGVIVSRVAGDQRGRKTLNFDFDRFGMSLAHLAKSNTSPLRVGPNELDRSVTVFVPSDACHWFPH